MQTTPRWEPTAQHHRYHEALRSLGCVITGETTDVQLHHVAGASARHNKIWIGQWYVLCLRRDLHDNRAGQIYNVSDNKGEFQLRYGDQRDVFLRQTHRLMGAIALRDCSLDLEDLPPIAVMEAIQGFRR